MKTSVRKETPISKIKKRTILKGSIAFAVIMLFLYTGCIKNENPPARFVFPVVTTADTSSVNATSVVSGGNITSDGGFAVSERGVCWSRLGNPSVAQPDSMTKDGTGSGVFVSNISGLAADSTYHIRAYATNSQGTSYGKDVSFQTKAK